ncbi:MAG TPA: T9SS type A sorting domain-containing protein [Cyclobacteriaceae bacterium]|nr:T9SS type A sorting domain-containing protein [Cyclobacteriaceae bacterium]
MLQLSRTASHTIKWKTKVGFDLVKRFFSMVSYTAIILFVLASQHTAGQQTIGPYGLNYKTYKIIPEKSFEPIDMALIERHRRQTSDKKLPETVGHNFKTHFVPNTDGTWKTVVSGVDSWFLKLRSNGAYGLALVFTGVELLPGETLYVYNQNGIRGPYTNHNLPRSGILPLDFLKGDEIMIEFDVPAGSKGHGTFIVETVSHAYQNIFARDVRNSKEAIARTDSDCYLCVEDDAIEKERRAVVRLVVQYDSTAVFCTGTLVNNSAHDNKPYILTAQHCVSSQFDADRTVFLFGFEDGDCVKLTNHNDLVLNGSFYRASMFENDFAILEMYDKPPLEFHPYYAGWDISDQYLNGVTCVHHPQGGPKKISLSNGAIRTSNFDDGSSRTPNAFWNVARWDVGVTEGGSSGASLFNKNNNVIGTLSGGSSACGAPYNDYFEKLSASWEASSEPDQQLKYWLDPLGSGVKSIDGNDPFEGINATCNTISNVKHGEQQLLLPYTNGEGYFSGYNSDSIASYAEKFSTADSAMLTGVTLNVGSVNIESPGGLLVSVHSDNGGVPGATLADSYIPYYRLADDSLNYIEFYPYVKLIGEFFISYTLSYSPGDSFALKQADWRTDLDNTAFVKLSSGWVPMSTISPNGAGSSLGIKITICENSIIDSPPEETSISFYPNPATTVLIGKLPDSAQGEFALHVYDLQGRKQNVLYSTYENNVVVTTADLSPGMYIVRLSTSHGVYQSKFVK